jgi:hypothetical protein
MMSVSSTIEIEEILGFIASPAVILGRNSSASQPLSISTYSRTASGMLTKEMEKGFIYENAFSLQRFRKGDKLF